MEEEEEGEEGKLAVAAAARDSVRVGVKRGDRGGMVNTFKHVGVKG